MDDDLWFQVLSGIIGTALVLVIFYGVYTLVDLIVQAVS